tara:strand:- start:372 stop:1208 length:837 start_codon:yes stop_codon:yes gene_type:complete
VINILEILKRFHFQILFAALLLLAIILTIQQKNYHRTKFINSANFISGGIYSSINNLEEYLNLKEINSDLQIENAFLRSNLLSSLKRINGNYYQFNDTLYRQKYVYRIADVISNGYSSPSNYVTLNMGSNDGIIEEMGVISPSGVVGIVGAVSKNYSTVISFLHPKTVISCKLKSNGVSGLLQWNGGDISKAQIKDIPITTRISEGDSVLTSGYSSVFPGGIFIGKIKSFNKDLESQTQRITVDLNIDFTSLNKVYIVENLYKNELDELNKKEIDLSE